MISDNVFFDDDYEEDEYQPRLPKPLPIGILEDEFPPEEEIWDPATSVERKKDYTYALKTYALTRDNPEFAHIAAMCQETIYDYEKQRDYSRLSRAEQKCRRLCDYVMFFYRNNNFYMRTPSFARSEELVPMLSVWLRPQYRAYQTAYFLQAKDAKEIVKKYRNITGKSSIRSSMEHEVAQYAIHEFTRADFASPLQIKKVFRQIFLSELFEDMDRAIVDINHPSGKKVFLRNNKTDKT